MAYRYGAAPGLHHISFAFASVDVGSGTNYAGGWYDHVSGSNDFNPPVNLGTADSAYGARVYLVTAGGDAAGDTTVRIAGTSWDPDTGTRTGADTEDITIVQLEAANTYHQTTKHWIGQVSVTKAAGNDVLCNYGWVSIWHHNHEDYQLVGFHIEWQGDGNDAGTDCIIYHHKTAGWTYNAAAPADPPILYDMQTDYNTEYEANNNEFGSYKRHNLTDDIAASSDEGLIFALVQTGSVPYGIGTVQLDMRHP